MRLVRSCVLTLALVLSPAPLFADSVAPTVPPPPPALTKPAPESVDDLRAMQEHTKAVLKKVMPATVGLRMGGRVGGAAGSGVIVDAAGTILTAGHVSGEPDRPVTVILSDGRTVRGKTLGANRGIDSGMIQITDTDKGPWPFVELGKSADLQPGQWVVATGHPGGFQPGRTPVVRVGRVTLATKSVVMTDCTLVGGDSGGPLFDMRGRLVGIHSRISGSITANIHVPVDTYRETWERLAKAEVWGNLWGGNTTQAYLGIRPDEANNEYRIKEVSPGSPADKAGLKVGDVLLRFAERDVKSNADLQRLLGRRRPGEEIALDVRRGEEELTLRVKIGRRPE
jgi:serine protease Do